jgi:acyl-CoA thioester hydrolase
VGKGVSNLSYLLNCVSVDSIVNQYLIDNCGRNPATSDEVGIIVNSGCNFFSQVQYPSVVDLGLRVNQLGKTSATYEVGIFSQDSELVKAVGGFTHVFCDKKSSRPQPQGMCTEVRKGLETLLVKENARL